MSSHNGRLTIVEGPSADQAYTLSQEEHILGRDDRSDIVLNAPSVSRRHARIVRRGGKFYIEDLGSSNGTFLNDQPIEKPVALSSGDEIALGRTIRLRFTQEAIAPQRTMLESAAPRIEPSKGAAQPQEETPPRFQVQIAGNPPQTYALERQRITIGRAEDNDIILPSRIVSRHHAYLEREGQGYRLVPLAEIANPVLFEGRPMSGPRRLRHEDKLRIGGLDPGSMVTMTYLAPAEARAVDKAQEVDFSEKTLLTVGRDSDNDIVLDNPTVSRFHAQLERVGQRFRVRDLRSSNGTFVNDRRIEGEVWLDADDVVRIGPHRFEMGQEALAQFDESGGLRVEAAGLQKWVRKDLNILQEISLVIQPREFIVVVGQSGGGKSTLVDAVAGYRPATHGTVHVNDVNVYENFDAIRNDIGYVPQRDIIHMELTIYQALDYAAQLRMPPDTSKEERHQRIMEVLEDLDLSHRKDTQISQLSGGQ
ncbi:MAG: FHA domain-containing protein, partial [bacterium]